MDLTNTTGLPAALARTAIDDDTLMGAAVSLRVTYDYRDGALTLAEEQTWDITLAPLETLYGELDGADPFGREGIDVFVLGLAHSLGERPVASLDLALEVGAWRSAVRVIGERLWLPAGEDLVPSDPIPFAVMPLHIGRAFGGKSEWDGLDVPFGDNPEGRGFYISADQAVGKPLPNLELLDHPLRAWSDHPPPAGLGFCPIHAGPRIRNGASFNESTGEIERLNPKLYHSAWPRMIAPPAAPGAPVSVSGINPYGPWSFALPVCPARLRIAFDDEEVFPPLELAQIGFETELHRVFLTWRHAFKYHVYPRQKRACELTAVAPGAGA